MDRLLAIQRTTIWLLPVGLILLAFAFVSRHWIERVPRVLDTWLFWIAGVLVTAGVLGVVAPYLIVFFGARPV